MRFPFGFTAKSPRTFLNVRLLTLATGVIVGSTLAVQGYASPIAVGIVPYEFFTQTTGAAATTPFAYNFAAQYFQTVGQYTSATLTYPGPGSPQTLPTAGTSPVYFHGLMSASQYQTNYPFGTYTFNLSNGSTVSTESVAYTQNNFPTAIPNLTSSSFNSLQGLNASNALTVNFDSFTVNPALPSPFGFTDYRVFNFATGVTVWDSGQLSPSATSATIPAGTLYQGTQYGSQLEFYSEGQTTDRATGTSLQTAFIKMDVVNFATAAILTSVPGGTPSNPTTLFSATPIGEVSGTIGGAGSVEYYSFLWNGGNFNVGASVSGANSAGSYLFSEGTLGDCTNGGSATLNTGDGFTGAINIPNLAPGTYCLGLNANNPNDPAFTFTFNTALPANTPEPASIVMLPLGLCLVACLRKRHRKA
jgi:hypothetical protein